MSELNEALLEGTSVNDWKPGAWTNDVPTSEDEYQPDIDPPRINDYAAFKKHKHYRKYFRPYRYEPFPAVMYHAKLDPKVVQNAEQVKALGPKWRREPYPHNQAQSNNMTGKSLPVKTETQKLAETVAAALASRPASGGSIDETAIAAIVAAVMAATGGSPAKATPAAVAEAAPDALGGDSGSGDGGVDPAIERQALLELAERDNIKVDGRWSNERIKKELKLD